MISISYDETHHIQNNIPLYATRYKRVMSFHDGIAPVENDKESFFINLQNIKLFNRTFLKAYGFYESIAAVKDTRGWFHIDISGKELYSERYSWVGNFNENRCVVRDFSNNYFHINNNGNKVYNQSYNYTGDFKYGIAVVVNSEGKSTHIDNQGELLHGVFFEELNIFHKGYAIAKDKDGYFHIDKKGDELYKQRYKKIEDFYNGLAFATTFENNKIVLSENDLEELQITMPTVDKDKILNESFAYFKYQILYSILKLDVLKNIKNNKEIDLPDTSLKLIYRWLYMEKIIDENKNLTQLGRVLEDELKSLIIYWQDLPFKTSTYMLETLKNGSECFSKIYKNPYFDFLKNNLHHAKISQDMNSYYISDYNHLIKFLDLNNEIVCDIGGGDGSFIKNVQRMYPNIETIVADKYVSKANENNIKIDFFKDFKIKGDVFLLSRILHDWSDENALVILQNLSKNLAKESTIYLFETIVPEEATYDKGITLSFHLLNFLGGYERTLKDFKLLMAQANLSIIEIYAKDSLVSLIKVKKQ